MIHSGEVDLHDLVLAILKCDHESDRVVVQEADAHPVVLLARDVVLALEKGLPEMIPVGREKSALFVGPRTQAVARELG